MVRNVKGGNKHKKMARKNQEQDDDSEEIKIRLVSCPDELYGVVTNIYGNCRVSVMCHDNETRQCVIRKAFRGRNKRNNEVTKGTFVLVGRRSWETQQAGKKEVTDLLYVYDNNQKHILKKQDIMIQFAENAKECKSHLEFDCNNDITFSTEINNDDTYQPVIELDDEYNSEPESELESEESIEEYEQPEKILTKKEKGRERAMARDRKRFQ